MTRSQHRNPVFKVYDRVLVALQGEVTDDVAAALSEEVLALIYESGAVGMVIDVTGVWMIDSHLCAVLSKVAASAKLMGTETILSGMGPDIAQTLQSMGVELENVRTALTVEQALEMTGLRFTERRRSEDEPAGMRGRGLMARRTFGEKLLPGKR